MAVKKEKVKNDYGKQIRESLEHWKHIREHGAGDPFWCDGVNLNLVRNHVIYYKRMCQEELQPEEYPAEYYLETPPKVDNNFMARADEVREHAKATLEVYLVNEDYKYLLSVRSKLSEKQQDAVHIANVLGYVSGLKIAIRDDDIVVMRRHETPSGYLESFQDCRKRVAEILEVAKDTVKRSNDGVKTEAKELPMGQLSLFDLFSLTMS